VRSYSVKANAKARTDRAANPDKKEKHLADRRNNHNIKKATDANYVAETRIRGAIKAALQRGNSEKKSKTEAYLGCTITEARAHIEALFQEGMSWKAKDRALWHIDHIRPVASFDKGSPSWMFEANHYTNLQPLWAVDNLKKGAKWETNDKK
jgi:hypothetical protein